MSKTVYLQKIKSKEYGGDTRKVFIENVVVNGSTAVAKVSMEGTKVTFVSLLNLEHVGDLVIVSKSSNSLIRRGMKTRV